MKLLCEQIHYDETAARLHDELSDELRCLLSFDRPWDDPPDSSHFDHTHRMWRALVTYSLGMRAHAVRQLLKLRQPRLH
jgi:hypothetical protein